jgi:multidrug resistance efflux pump
VLDALEFQQQARARTHILEIPNLPSMAGLVVKPGDRVVSGQPLARYVNDAALEEVRARVASAKATVAQSKADLNRLNATFASYKPTLEERIKSAEVEYARMKSLTDQGAEPRVKLAQVQARLSDAKAERLRELSAHTTRQAQLETAIQKAELTIQTASAQSDSTLERQWVKAPFKALVSEIRVRTVTAKGVNLEITLLEEEK